MLASCSVQMLLGLYIVVMITVIDLPQAIFAMDMLGTLKSPLEHHRKHVLRGSDYIYIYTKTRL